MEKELNYSDVTITDAEWSSRDKAGWINGVCEISYDGLDSIEVPVTAYCGPEGMSLGTDGHDWDNAHAALDALRHTHSHDERTEIALECARLLIASIRDMAGEEETTVQAQVESWARAFRQMGPAKVAAD